MSNWLTGRLREIALDTSATAFLCKTHHFEHKTRHFSRNTHHCSRKIHEFQHKTAHHFAHWPQAVSARCNEIVYNVITV